MTHREAKARALGKVRNARHAFRSASQDNVRAAQHDLFSSKNDRAESGPAGLVHGKRRHAIGHSGAKSNLSRDVRTAAGLTSTAPDRIVDLVGSNLSAPQTFRRHHGPQIRRGPTLQRSTK